LLNILLIISCDCLLLKSIFLNNLFIYINYKYNSSVYLSWSIFSLFSSSGILLFKYAFVIGTSGKIFLNSKIPEELNRENIDHDKYTDELYL
jgi:hypothetical protein